MTKTLTKGERRRVDRFLASLAHLKAQGVPMIAIAEIQPWEDNPRLNEEAIPRIVESMLTFGWTNPIIVREKSGFLEAGHTRLAAALHIARVHELELLELPCVRVEHSKRDAKLYALADNKLGELAEWDPTKLGLVMDDFETPELELAGWDPAELRAFEDIGEGLPGGGGGAEEARATLAERFGVPPFSILDARQGYWFDRKRAWVALGVQGEMGRTGHGGGDKKVGSLGHNPKLMGKRGLAAFGADTSIFDPVLAELMVRWFTPDGGSVLDPFAGECTKGIVTESIGRRYTGIELRQEQVDINRAQAEVVGVSPTWICGDSLNLEELVPPGEFDLVWTSPPYYDLEVYSDDAADGSAKETYEEFMAFYRKVFEPAVARLKDGGFLIVKIGEIRSKTNGAYRNFVGDNISLFRDLGLSYYNEMILLTPLGNLPLRTSKMFSASRKVGKTHQNVLCFHKGNVKKAGRGLGEASGVAIPGETSEG